jgi:tubulin epsilon
LSDVRRNIEKLRTQLNFISWNQEGWKTGLCSQPAHGQAYSLLSLANNTCIRESFAGMKERFNMLYKRKAHLHHYAHVDGMDMELFPEAASSLTNLISEYRDLEKQQGGVDVGNENSVLIDRLKILS